MVRTRTDSDDSDTCPICLESPNFAVETNCGHMYCGDCILEVRRNEPSITPISCPFCRQDVTVLLACFTMSEVDSNSTEQAEIRGRIMREVRQYNFTYHQHPRSKPIEVTRSETRQANSQMQQQRQQVQLNSASGVVTGAAVVVGVGAVLVAGVLASLGIGVLRLALGSARRRE